MIRVKHEGVARHKAERVLVLFLRIDLVRGTELLDVGCGKAHCFLQLGCNNEPLALGFGQLRLHVSLASDGQGISGHIAAIGTQHTGERIPEGGFTVAAFAISDDQGLDADLSDSG